MPLNAAARRAGQHASGAVTTFFFQVTLPIASSVT
jgi:hypothetical protein